MRSIRPITTPISTPELFIDGAGTEPIYKSLKKVQPEGRGNMKRRRRTAVRNSTRGLRTQYGYLRHQLVIQFNHWLPFTTGYILPRGCLCIDSAPNSTQGTVKFERVFVDNARQTHTINGASAVKRNSVRRSTKTSRSVRPHTYYNIRRTDRKTKNHAARHVPCSNIN